MIFRHVFILSRIKSVLVSEIGKGAGVETGGPLAGYRSDDGALVVVEAGGPGPHSRLSCSSVYLDGSDTLSWVEHVFDEQDGLYWYVGDWHFHRRLSLRPSSKDRTAMQVVSAYKGFGAANPLSLICGSNQGILDLRCYVWTGARLTSVKWSWLAAVPDL